MRTIKVVIGLVNGNKIINKLHKFEEGYYRIEQTIIDIEGHDCGISYDTCDTYAEVKELYPQFDNNVLRNELEQASMETNEHLEG